MGLIQSQEHRGQLTKIERRMVQAMAERAQKANVTLKTFNTFILKFPKIDASFEAVREVFNKAGLHTALLHGAFLQIFERIRTKLRLHWFCRSLMCVLVFPLLGL